MRFLKHIPILLATTAIVFICFGCADNKTGKLNNDTINSLSETNEADSTAELKPDLPDVMFNGEKFVFLVRGPAYNEWMSQDIYVEQQKSEPIADAVYERNLYLEEKYNIKIREYGSRDVGADARKTIATASDDYDAVMADTGATASLASQKYLFDLHTIPYMDLTKEWWDQRSVSQLSIGGKLYFCTGDLSIMANDATWILMFNKPMIGDLKFESPYDLVRNNKWTIEKMLEMAKGASNDENGDGVMKYTTDKYGFVTHGSSCEGFFFGSGCNIITKDDNDMPAITMMSERALSVLEAAHELMGNRDIVVNGSVQSLNAVTQMQPVFQSGRALFYGEVMQCIIRLRAMEIDFGVIPFPKLDENQASYNHFIHTTAAMLSIPVTNNDLDKTGIILEAMTAKSKYTLRKAYYDVCLQGKFMRDNESAEMLDIILRTRNFDIGYIYGWGDLFENFRTCLTSGKGDFASKFARSERAAEKMMDKTIKSWLEGVEA